VLDTLSRLINNSIVEKGLATTDYSILDNVFAFNSFLVEILLDFKTRLISAYLADKR